MRLNRNKQDRATSQLRIPKLLKTVDDFSECYSLAHANSDLLLQVFAQHSYELAEVELAEFMNLYALSMFVSSSHTKQRQTKHLIA
jgi:hypothetical protein